MAEYPHLTFQAAVWETPLTLAIILLPTRNERNGGKTGPSYATNAAIDARNNCRAWLEKTFTLTDQPLAEIGWQLK